MSLLSCATSVLTSAMSLLSCATSVLSCATSTLSSATSFSMRSNRAGTPRNSLVSSARSSNCCASGLACSSAMMRATRDVGSRFFSTFMASYRLLSSAVRGSRRVDSNGGRRLPARGKSQSYAYACLRPSRFRGSARRGRQRTNVYLRKGRNVAAREDAGSVPMPLAKAKRLSPAWTTSRRSSFSVSKAERIDAVRRGASVRFISKP